MWLLNHINLGMEPPVYVMQQLRMNADVKSKGGRPHKPDSERRIQRSIRLVPRLWAKIDQAGKEEFEAMLERWKPKEKKAAE